MLRPLVTHSRQFLPGLAIALLSLAGASMIAYATRWGPWAGSDSVEYVEAARNLAAGRGLVLVRATGTTVPMYLRPPLYSIALAALMVVGLDAVEAGRLAAISFFYGLLLMPGLLALVVKDRYALPLTLAAYLLASPTLVANSTGLMSESLFILLVFLAVSLAVVSTSEGRRALLPVAAVVAGLAWLTRFAGVACVFVVALVPFLERRRRLGSTMARSLGLTLMGVLPTALWALYVRAGGYTPGVYSLPEGNLWDALQPVRAAYVDILWDWLPLRLFMPIGAYRPRATILFIFCAILALAAGWLALRTKRCSARPNARAFVSLTGLLLVLFAAVHAFVVAASFLIVALPKPALDQRVLLPSQVTFVTGLVLVLYSLLIHLRSSAARLALPLVFVVPLVWTGWPSTWHLARQLSEEGWGYTNSSWHQSPIVDALRILAPSLTVVSNDIDAVTFFAERAAFPIPELEAGRPPSSWVPFGENPQSESESLFADGGAALVVFSQGRYQFSQLYGDQALARLQLLLQGLVVLYEGPDGGIYLSHSP